MQLSKRLKTVADCVTPGNTVADIGCDHAYTSIYLIKNQIAPNVIAMDVNAGPLKRAAANIEKYGYGQRIQTRRSDGAKCLEAGEAETIIIGGMGGALTIKILSDSKAVIRTAKELVLQPQSEIGSVRRYLHRTGFILLEEDMIEEEGKYYVVMKAVPGTEWYDKEIFYLYGKHLLEHRNPVLKQYLLNGRETYERLSGNLENQDSDKARGRLLEIRTELGYIEEGLDFFK